MIAGGSAGGGDKVKGGEMEGEKRLHVPRPLVKFLKQKRYNSTVCAFP